MRSAVPFILLLALLAIPLASAEITVQLPQDYFNIGDTMEVAASAVSEQSILGFVRFTAVCGGYSLSYYLLPVELQQGFRSQVNAPPLQVLPTMKGPCAIKVDILDEQSQVIESGSSSRFDVSDGLNIILLDENLTTLPGTTKKIEGIVRGAGDKMVDANIELSFDEESYRAATFNGKFSVLLGISSVAKTGMHSLSIAADDTQKNKGSFSGSIEVVAVPSHLEIASKEAQQDPGKSITYIDRKSVV